MSKIKYNIPWWKTNLGINEIERIKNAILQRNVTQGVLTEKLEKEIANFLDVPFVMLTSSGSAALLAALVACGIKPKEEVIVPNITFRATAQVPLLLNIKVKVVDVESKRPLIDPGKVEEAISSRTKAIIPVHLNGRCANIKEIKKIANKYNLIVIEDAAQALGSQNKEGFIGTQADAGIFSLGITKLITTVRGGVVVTKNRKLYNRLKNIRDFGFVKYGKDIKEVRGFNLKFNDIFAAIGLEQIKQIKKKMKALKDIYSFYKERLRNLDYIKLIDIDFLNGELPLWIEVFCSEKKKVIGMLAKKGIQAKALDVPMSGLFNNSKKFVNSIAYSRYGMILPSGPGHSKEDLTRVVEALRNIKSCIKTKSVKEMNRLINCKSGRGD